MLTEADQLTDHRLGVSEVTPRTTASRGLGSPVVWFSALGSAFLVLQLFVFLGWIVSSDFRRISPAINTIPESTKIWAWTWQAVSVLVLVFVVVHCVRQTRREGRISFDGLLMIGFLSVFWQDTLLNYVHPIFLYNSYFINLGAWDTHIPGWIFAGGNKIPEPLVLVGPVYGWWFVLFAATFCVVTSRIKRKWPQLNKIEIFVVGTIALSILDFCLESIALHTNVAEYVTTIPVLTVFSGRPYQFPIYEAVFIGGMTALFGAIRVSHGSFGQSLPERGLRRMQLSSQKNTVLAVLAFIGLTNIVYLVYNVALNLIGVYGNHVHSIAPFLRNGV